MRLDGSEPRRRRGTGQTFWAESPGLAKGFEGYVMIVADVDPDKDLITGYKAKSGNLQPRAPAFEATQGN